MCRVYLLSSTAVPQSWVAALKIDSPVGGSQCAVEGNVRRAEDPDNEEVKMVIVITEDI